MRSTCLHALILGSFLALAAPPAFAAPRHAPPPGVAPFEPSIAARSTTWFHRQLDPYGYWTELPPYGQVWQPSIAVVGARFKPYASGGRWVATDVGWTFVTDWPFDAIVWHYGRWLDTTTDGWVWVPGTTWGPAWVTWRTGPDLVAWAPLPPWGPAPTTYSSSWCLVPATRFLRNDVARFDLPIDTAPSLFQQTHWLRAFVERDGVRYPAGPRFAYIQALSKAPLPRLHVVLPAPGVVRAVNVSGLVARQAMLRPHVGRMTAGHHRAVRHARRWTRARARVHNLRRARRSSRRGRAMRRGR